MRNILLLILLTASLASQAVGEARAVQFRSSLVNPTSSTGDVREVEADGARFTIRAREA